MNEYVVLVQIGEDEGRREYIPINAVDADDAEAQALEMDSHIRNIAVFERIR